MRDTTRRRPVSLKFNGATGNKYVDLGANFGFEHDDAFSGVAWLRTSAVLSGTIISKTNGSTDSPAFRGWQFVIDANGKLEVWIRTEAGVAVTKETDATFNDGAWHLAAFTYSGAGAASGLLLYADGDAEATTTIHDNLAGGTIINSATAKIGARITSGPAVELPWNGNLYGVGLYNRVLTSGEIGDMYNSGVPVDLRTLDTEPDLVGYSRWGVEDAALPTIPDLSATGAHGTATTNSILQADAPGL